MGKDYEKRWPRVVDSEDAEYLGSAMDVDVYRDRDTGKIFHISSAITDSNRPVRYEGRPSKLGYAIGSILDGPKKR
jgi:hypothetical protein